MDEKNIPSYVKNRVDVKYATVVSFAAAIKGLVDNPPKEFQIGKQTKVFLLTTFGTITGDIVLSGESPKDDVVVALSQSFVELRNKFLAEAEAEEASGKVAVNNVAAILIRNAKVIPYNAPQCVHNYGILHVFTDQICGVTFGDYPGE